MRTMLCSTYLKLSLGPIDGILQINFSAQLLNEAQGNMFFLRKFHVKKTRQNHVLQFSKYNTYRLLYFDKQTINSIKS